MRTDRFPGVRLKQLLGEAGLLAQFDEAVHGRSYPKMKALIEKVATSPQEAKRFVGVVFANPKHYEKVISDLHYNGKTVNERLAAEGLLDQFTAAVRAKDNGRMIELLQQAAITKTWASSLSAKILDDPNQPPIHLNLADPRNSGLRHVANKLKFPTCIRPLECPRDPYMNLGSHPESVERIWDQLGSALPKECRCILLGSPGLVAPRSGVLLAKAYGTAYILRIPQDSMDAAIQAGARTRMKWSDSHTTDLKQDYGDGWIFGKYLKQEPDWLLAAYYAVEGSPAARQWP
jgi:hypothetical protein